METATAQESIVTLTESAARQIASMLSGDIKTGKALIRDYINATIGFEKLSRITKKDSKSLMRMFSVNGNPTANNLFEVINVLQEAEGVHYELQPVR